MTSRSLITQPSQHLPTTLFFIDADPAQIDAAVRCGAPYIEIHTGHFADATDTGEQAKELQRISRGVAYALEQGLTVNAGHGLHYHNVEEIASIPGIYELNIGHGIMARAMFTGLKPAVAEMKMLMLDACPRV